MSESAGSGHDAANEERAKRIVAAALGAAAAAVRVSARGPTLVLRGGAADYATKALAEACLRAAGFRDVDNCLRVTPGNPAFA